MPKLFIQKKDGKTRIFVVKKILTTIGRDPQNDLVLEDKKVSSLHAHILLKEGKYWITDLNSTNGTSVNGKFVKQHYLQNKDKIEIGDYQIIFQTEENATLVSTQTPRQIVTLLITQLKKMEKEWDKNKIQQIESLLAILKQKLEKEEEKAREITETIEILKNENILMKKQIEESKFVNLIGNSSSMQKIFETIEKVAPTDIPVLISGETGTGKELVAQAIHEKSGRAKRPFIPINCAAIPENLLEAELFGYEKGAFTGANEKKLGKFELAHTGTLFLDEIAELNDSLQVKLLRFLQEQKIERIGATETIPLDVRIIAATNKNIPELVKRNEFREDLYYRLKVVEINLPPLRKREDDVLLLAHYFLNEYQQKYRTKKKRFSLKTKKILKRYSWPGNIRELENKIKRAILMSEGILIEPADMELEKFPLEHLSLKKARQELEISYLQSALKRNKNNLSLSARELEIDRRTLKEMMKKYGIEWKKK
jgi:two-component system NtrC family response regulator